MLIGETPRKLLTPTRRGFLTGAAAVAAGMALLKPGQAEAWLKRGVSGYVGPPINTVAPSISQAYVNSLTVLNTGTWAGPGPIWFSCQPQVNGANVGVDCPHYMPTSADNLGALRFAVTAWNRYGSSTLTYSNILGVTTGTWTTVTDLSTLNTAIASPPPSGLIRMAAGYYGAWGLTNQNFGRQIILSGDPGVGNTWFDYIDLYGTDLFTLENVTCKNKDGSNFCVGVANNNGSTINLNYVRADSGAVLGSPVGNQFGINVTNNGGGAKVNIYGHCQASVADVYGVEAAISFSDNDASCVFTETGMTIRNIEVDCHDVKSSSNVTIDRAFGTDTFYVPGDHPDFIQVDLGPNMTACQNITMTNSGYEQGSGNGSQGEFIASYGITNYVSVNNWIFQGLTVLGDFLANMNLGGSASATVAEHFFQGWGGSGGAPALSNGANNVHISDTVCESINTSGVGTGYSATNITTIAQASGSTDRTTLDPWLALPQHAMSRRRT